MVLILFAISLRPQTVTIKEYDKEIDVTRDSFEIY